MKTIEEGIIIETNEHFAKVKTNKHGDCKNCGACPGDNAAILSVQNPIGAIPGQTVSFQMKQENMLKAAFIVYIMPLLVVSVAAYLGWLLAEFLSFPAVPFEIAGGVIALIGAVIIIKSYDKKASNNISTLPIIVQIKQ